MALQLSTPIFIEQAGKYLYPAPDVISGDDRLFIVSSSDHLAQAVISGINEHLSSSHSLSVSALDTIADDLLTAGNEFSTESLAMAYVNRNGCTTMQIGKSRVMHISKLSGEIEYDSSNHIPHTLSSKAKTQLHSRLYTGDVVLLTLTDRVDSQRLLNLLSDEACDETQLSTRLKSLLEKHRDEAPATFALKFSGSRGLGAGLKDMITDINLKWISIFIVLAALIGLLAWLTFNSDIPSFFTDKSAESNIILADTIDTLQAPTPAVQDIQNLPEDLQQPHQSADAMQSASSERNDIVRDEPPRATYDEPTAQSNSGSQYIAPAETPVVSTEPSTEPAVVPQSPADPTE